MGAVLRSDGRRATGQPTSCPCGSPFGYAECCGPLHLGSTVALTAEALMRSRFCAFAVGESEYLIRTWHSTTRPAAVRLDPAQRWTRLEVLSVERGGLFDDIGAVEFRAHYRQADRAGTLHERSRFRREVGHWRYVDGVTDDRPVRSR
jgi:SEC-C motif domain protein